MKGPTKKKSGEKINSKNFASFPDDTNHIFFDIMLKAGIITKTGQLILTHYIKTWQKSALEGILETHMATESQVANTLAEALNIDRIFNILQLEFAYNTTRILPYKTAKSLEMILMVSGVDGKKGQVHSDTLSYDLVCSNPCLAESIARIKKDLKKPINIAVAERSEVIKAIDELFPLAAQLPTLLAGFRD